MISEVPFDYFYQNYGCFNNTDVYLPMRYPINSYEPTELANTDFDDIVSTPVSKVYKTTYDILTSARSRSYIAMNRELLIGMNNNKRR